MFVRKLVNDLKKPKSFIFPSPAFGRDKTKLSEEIDGVQIGISFR